MAEWTDEQVEAAARAICDLEWQHSQPWEHKPQSFKNRYRDYARVAFSTLPPPTIEPGTGDEAAKSFVIMKSENEALFAQLTGETARAEVAERALAELTGIAEGLVWVVKVFLGEDERFQIAVGGNPIATSKMLTAAHAALAAYTTRGEMK